MELQVHGFLLTLTRKEPGVGARRRRLVAGSCGWRPKTATWARLPVGPPTCRKDQGIKVQSGIYRHITRLGISNMANASSLATAQS